MIWRILAIFLITNALLIRMQLLMSFVAQPLGLVTSRTMLGWVTSVMIIGRDAAKGFNALTKKSSNSVQTFLPSMTPRLVFCIGGTDYAYNFGCNRDQICVQS